MIVNRTPVTDQRLYPDMAALFDAQPCTYATSSLNRDCIIEFVSDNPGITHGEKPCVMPGLAKDT